jgi:hypothetical protein
MQDPKELKNISLELQQLNVAICEKDQALSLKDQQIRS